MSAAPGPHRFDDVRVILAPNGTATTKEITPNFYAELDGEFNNFEGHILVMAHSFSEDWGMWEMHPTGDEIVVLQEGDVDFVLWRDGAEAVSLGRRGLPPNRRNARSAASGTLSS